MSETYSIRWDKYRQKEANKHAAAITLLQERIKELEKELETKESK